ncbi:ef-hand superfamily Ca2+-modulated protein [Grosmannia clavigera kw1407]|uniref:Calmodulin n=1 Tax=Grosmannia clavigera (strain kw1407 / UAMH 11150) TaxID=655863 RepID=F0X8W1_GROCL|nr:ef-hand superfamily Ca2+-modulated protein [Grosmannia clavigera kw1407]EFX05455.1 ef-hand superfamily Ca2+-modulated protein [Grosmannia clavigera kw1407]
MPPKRKAASTATAIKTARQSKLAKENNITAQEEAEIREAFSLFSEPMDGEKQGVLPIGDLRRAMIALGIPPSSQTELSEFVSILDPDDEGFAVYAPFVAICALKMHQRAQSSDAHLQEVDEAFRLFTAGSGSGASITMTHLRRIAAMLKEDVSDDLLRDMILEANGGATGVAQGVDRDAFESVMRRAGVWR